MKQLFLFLFLVPFIVSGQYNSDDILYNRMENLKGNVSFIKELNYHADKNGKQEAVAVESREFSFNKNKQVTEVNWRSIKEDQELVYEYTFEAASPFYTSREIVEGNFVHHNTSYSYTQKNTQAGSSIYKNFTKGNSPFREFVLDKNKNIVALYNYYRGEKAYTAHLFEYNSQGQMVKKTRLYYEKPSYITTYKLNEYGDIIEELEFDVDEDKFSWKYEYIYTYDTNNNWVTMKKVMMGFNDKGKLITKKDELVYEFYSREIKY